MGALMASSSFLSCFPSSYHSSASFSRKHLEDTKTTAIIPLNGNIPQISQQAAQPEAQDPVSMILNGTEIYEPSTEEGIKENLTKRELDVLRELAKGYSNAAIADELVLSIVTVNSYLRSIYSKLGVSSR